VTNSDPQNSLFAFITGALGINLNPDFFVINSLTELVGLMAASASFIYLIMQIIIHLYKFSNWAKSSKIKTNI
jgi:hypothetical protein